MDKPIIFLAFANEKTPDGAFLQKLADEQRQLREILGNSDHCELIIRPNVTISEIFDVFQKEENRGRICLFHYAGHANGFQLLLESADGGSEVAHSEGLMAFLISQKDAGLSAVMLNGCATQNQALKLADAGIATIATSQAINDDVAVEFSARFYSGLAQNITLKEAFDGAVSKSKTKKGTANLRDFYWDGAEESEIDGFPWELYYVAQSGEENLLDWTLEKAQAGLVPHLRAKNIVSGLAVDHEVLGKIVDRYLVKRDNSIKKCLVELRGVLEGQNIWLDKYLKTLLTQEKSLRKIKIKEGVVAYEKARSTLKQEIILAFR